MTRQPFVLALLAFSLVVAACTGGRSKTEPAAAVQVRGPILGMLVASSLSDQGKPIDPRFSFRPDQPQITVIVQVGRIHGSPLDVTWYRLAAGKQKTLFRHQVEVSTYDRAYSIGRNPGELAVGTYRVAATLEGRSQAVEWQITPSESSSLGEDSPAGGSQTQAGQPPSSGQSGVVPSSAEAGQYPLGEHPGPGFDFCVGGVDGCASSAIENGGEVVFVTLEYSNPEPVETSPSPGPPDTERNRIYVAVRSNSYELGTALGGTDARGKGAAFFVFDPCRYGVRSDLPGARFLVKGYAVERGLIRSTEITLGEDTRAPRVSLSSKPGHDGRVHSGDTIELTAAGDESSDFGWQTGVKSLTLTGPVGPIGDPSVFGQQPQPCDRKSRTGTMKATYAVPATPPPIIRICATASDFSGNEGSDCADFYTGDVWVGSMHTETQAEYFKGVAVLHSVHAAVYDSTLELVVGADRQISGHGTARLVSGVCSASGPTTREINFDISGVAHADQLEMYLTFVGSTPPKSESCGFGVGFMEPTVHQPLFVPITGSGRASGNATDGWDPNDITHFEGTHVVELVCQDCPGGGA